MEKKNKSEMVSAYYRIFPLMIVSIAAVLLLLGAIGFRLLSSRSSDTKITGQDDNLKPTVPVRISGDVNIALAYLKEGGIYTADYDGLSDQVLDVKNEEITPPESLYMKLSPDKKYLAYIGISGGLDSALKVVGIQQKKIISQEVYGSANITDFAWSPDSKKIAVAVNLKHKEKDYTSSIYIIDPFDKTGGKLLFNAENIEIIQTEWPDENNIYYSRIAYAPEQNCAIVRYGLDDKSRDVKLINSTNGAYNDISSFTVKFLISSEKKDILAYVAIKEEPMRSKGTGYELRSFSMPALDLKEPLLNYVLPKEAKLYKSNIVGIEEIYGSPDSSLVLVSIPQEEQSLSLQDMGPSGSFHSVKLAEQAGKIFLFVWSEFDGKQSISAYDFEKLVEMRKKFYSPDPLWRLENSSSFDK